MRPTINVVLDTKLIEDEVGEAIERTSADERKAVKWLKENSPIDIEVKYQQPFWEIDAKVPRPV
jgi:hypothetical protein